MGKIRTRILGLEEVEKKQKQKQKERAQQKKSVKKTRAPGLKGGERMVAVEVDEKSVEKMEKAKKIIEKKVSQKRLKTRIRGKNYRQAKKLIEKSKKYRLDQAISLLKKIKYSKFDESVELHLNIDKTGLKGEAELPHPTGKVVRVKIVDEKILTEIERGRLDFDILITHPSFMPRLAKFAKILGPKGLMPNPKTGTISDKPEEVAKKFTKGIVHWKTEAKAPLIHQMIGKSSFKDKALIENASAFIKAVGISHIRKAFIKTTMTPSLKLNLEELKS